MRLLDREIGLMVIEEAGIRREVPGYMCGHCNAWIILNAARSRARRRCLSCSRLICEKSKVCAEFCTPIPDLAKDHFEGPVARKYGQFAFAEDLLLAKKEN